MNRISRVPLARVGLAAAALLVAACDVTPDVLGPPTAGGGSRFDSYVALGNSITAGYQAGGISPTTQTESYAYLIATQSMQTRFAIPLLAAPGCPPPIVNIQTGSRGNAAFTGTTCALRDPSMLNAIINNVAVPGATVADPIAQTTTSSNTLTTLFLGGLSQARKASLANPTFASIWIGNNDVIEAAVSGVTTATAGISRGITPTATFATTFNQIVDTLTMLSPRLGGGVMIAVLNAANAPILFPAAALFNPAFKAGFDQYAGGATTILPSCTPTTTSLISFRIVSAMQAGTHPRVIACEKGQFPQSALVGEVYVLDAAEQAQIAAAVTAYNTAIKARGDVLGWAYYDPNPALLALRASGGIPSVPNLASATQTFGTYISLDGVHATRPGHVLIANGVIGAINTKYGTQLPVVQ